MEGLLQPHGTPPNSKQDGIFRLLCKNLNRINIRITRNKKLNKAININDELEADGILYSKYRLKLHHKNVKKLLQTNFPFGNCLQSNHMPQHPLLGQKVAGRWHRYGGFWLHYRV